MNVWVRRMIRAVPGLAKPYYSARKAYNMSRTVRAARSCFANLNEYRDALVECQFGELTTIHTLDGLTFTIRRNRNDAAVLGEVFLDKGYTQYCILPTEPVVVDVGAYI